MFRIDSFSANPSIKEGFQEGFKIACTPISSGVKWIQDTKKQLNKSFDLENKWDEYIKQRFVVEGFPIATITSVAAAYLFNCTSLKNGLIYSTFNYTLMTAMIEVAHQYYDNKCMKAVTIIGLSYVITNAFMSTICKTSLSYKSSTILAIAAFSGQLFREFLMHKQENSTDI